MTQTVKVLQTSDLAPGQGKTVDVDAEFNVKTGEVTDPPADEGVHSFPVKVEGDDVLVQLD